MIARLLFVLVVAVLFVTGAWCDELPEAPRPKTADKHFFFAVGVLAAAQTADAITTERTLARGCHELNPVYGSRYPTPARVAVVNVAFFAGEVTAGYLLKRHFMNRRGFLRHVWLLPFSEAIVRADAAWHNEGLRCP